MFELANYEREIREGATKASIELPEALVRFIYNLTIMRPHYDIFPEEVNFRLLGQQWNKLMSDVRNKQKNEMLELLKRPSRIMR